MKAILVIDELPKDCTKCKFCGYIAEIKDGFRSCMITGNSFEEKYIIDQLKACPLKPLPEARTLPREMTEGTNYGEEPWFSDGWNACLDEIGEQDESKAE